MNLILKIILFVLAVVIIAAAIASYSAPKYSEYSATLDDRDNSIIYTRGDCFMYISSSLLYGGDDTIKVGSDHPYACTETDYANYRYEQRQAGPIWVASTTPVKTPKVTSTPIRVDTKPIFAEATRLSNDCEAEIDFGNDMEIRIFGTNNRPTSDKNLIMERVTQRKRTDAVCLKEALYLIDNRNVLDSGTPKGWATTTINRLIDNNKVSEDWYQQLNQNMGMSISSTRYTITRYTYYATVTTTPTERTYSPGDSMDIEYTTDDSVIQNAIKQCAEAGGRISSRAGVSNARSVCSQALSIVHRDGTGMPEYETVVYGLEQLINGYDQLLSLPNY